MVFVRRDGHRPPLSPAYEGPYKVLQRSRHTFKLQMGSRTEVVSVHRLKPAATPPDALPALPARRGRPPAAPPAAPPTAPPAVPATRSRRVHFAPLPEPQQPVAAPPPGRPSRSREPPHRWGIYSCQSSPSRKTGGENCRGLDHAHLPAVQLTSYPLHTLSQGTCISFLLRPRFQNHP
jgi:hypothetical protein